jgi:hypothetical protein
MPCLSAMAETVSLEILAACWVGGIHAKNQVVYDGIVI